MQAPGDVDFRDAPANAQPTHEDGAGDEEAEGSKLDFSESRPSSLCDRHPDLLPGTRTCCSTASMTSPTEVPCIIASGRSTMRCSSTGRASALISSGVA